MDFAELKTFIDKSMRMSHIYQPVMLMTLLEKGGKASVTSLLSSYACTPGRATNSRLGGVRTVRFIEISQGACWVAGGILRNG